MSKLMISIAFFLMACLLAANVSAATFEELDNRISACNLVLKNVLGMPDSGIPKDLLQRCRGLAIFPGVIRVGLFVGASYGNGVVLRRDEKTAEWSRPAFFGIKGGSLGLQVGAQSTDLILLLMSEQSVERLLEERFILGADVSVAAGPVGREASAETNVGFESGILSYSRSRGLFAGLALNGASLEPDAAANGVYHGTDISVQDVFYEGKGALSDNARLLVKTLEDATR
ncbi:MAG: lipid-binding SYLF domain-containing protein [Desulfomonile tiedjei]|uniref:Lipid-binding SYLF domain-containing protein n=1 Tax=Desulfomonile tiedjei TaxID=2358 RepID=A0A9D6UZ28_9BACT|nr:lipid-binding SYLF domain-containing protein [Desulfomonile tiedjei]